MFIPCLSADNKEYKLFIPDKIPEAKLHYTTEAYIFDNMLIVPEAINLNKDYYDIQCNNVLRYTTDGVYNNIKNYNIKIIDDTAIYASLIPNANYSHFTMQCLGTLLLAKNNNILSNNIKLIIPNSTNFHMELYELFNIPLNNLLSIEKNTLYIFKSLFFSNLYFNTTMSGNYKQFDPKFIHLYNSLLKPINKIKTEKKIYLTRINEKTRVPINEKDIINFFQKQGFAIVDCAKLSVSEQINTIRNAETIVATHGANGANLVYKEEDRFKFVEIFGNRFVSWHTMILKGKNCDYASIKCQPVNANLEAPFKISLDLIEESLTKNTHKFNSETSSKNEQEYLKTLPIHINQITTLHYTNDNKIPGRYPKYTLLTYHNTWLTVSDDLTKLIHLPLMHNYLIFNLNKDKLSIYIEDANRYISSIDSLGNISVSKKPFYFKFQYNMANNNISIIQEEKYLSARRGGLVSFADKNLIWEHFYIKE